MISLPFRLPRVNVSLRDVEDEGSSNPYKLLSDFLEGPIPDFLYISSRFCHRISPFQRSRGRKNITLAVPDESCAGEPCWEMFY